MDKRILSIIVVIVIIIMIVITVKVKSNQNENLESNSKTIEIIQDEETGEYVVRNKITGEYLDKSLDETNLHIYEIDSNYNPDPAAKTNVDIQDYEQYNDTVNKR